MKTCSDCKKTKPLDQFHHNRTTPDGLRRICKTCAKARTAEYQKTDAGKETMLRFARSEKGIAVRRRYEKSPNGRATIRRYNESPGGRAKKRAAAQRHISKYPDKIRARRQVTLSIERGDLPPASECFCSCGAPAVHYHHADYSYPLEVSPLCLACHSSIVP